MTGADVVDRLLAVAEAIPSRPAVIAEEGPVDYGSFIRLVRAYAAEFSAEAEPRVLILLPQCADAYAAMFAAGLAGGYYAPANTQAPADKLTRLLHQFCPNLVVAAPEMAELAARGAPQARIVTPAALDREQQFDGAGKRHRLAYVIFTSGSTGIPKGVMISRSALAHYVDWISATMGVTPEDRWPQHPNIAFDLSVMDIYGALCHGAALCPLTGPYDRLMPAQAIANHRLTIWNSVPSVIGLMMQAKQVTAANFATLRLATFCGEPLLPQHLDAIFAARPDLAVQNTYGPTEATVSCTWLPLGGDDYRRACASSVGLGAAIPGMELHLVGGPSSDEGEIVIVGPQLAEGYWNAPDLTAKAFREIEIGERRTRAYFTGDWAERRGDQLFFKERIDFQVKVRGYRIELDEVAAAIRHLGWPVTCVVKHGEGLAAAIEVPSGAGFDPQALRDHLLEVLEPHAVPETIRRIDHMPRNDNDKIDRRAVAAWLAAGENE